MDQKLYNVAAKACLDAYDKNTGVGMGTEYSYSLKTVKGRKYQVIAIAGTNDCLDAIKDINLLSWKGIKLSAYNAANRIMEHVSLSKIYPVLVTGHSMGGAVAVAIKRLHNVQYCVTFGQARCLRYCYDRKMSNTVIFTDPDDIVSKLAYLSFGLPKCERIKAPDDHTLFSLSDHAMENWVNFTGDY